MKSRIVADGEQRLLESDGFRERLLILRKGIRAKYAAEFAGAGLIRRLVSHWRMGVEYRREREQLMSSRHALYLTKVY